MSSRSTGGGSHTPPGGKPPGPGDAPGGKSNAEIIEDLRKAVEALTAVMAGRASGGSRGSSSGGDAPSSGGRKTIGEMTNDEVVARMAVVHGRTVSLFTADQVKRLGPDYGDRVDWWATNAAYRRAASMEDQGGFSAGRAFASQYSAARSRSHGDSAAFSTIASILPDAIARPVISAFERNRGWKDLGEAFSGLARDAGAAARPFAAIASLSGVAARVAVAAGVGSVAASVAMAPIAAAGAAGMAMFGVGQAQMRQVTALAPYDGRMVGSFVDLEVSRLSRNFRLAGNMGETGSVLMGTRNLLESSLVELKSATGVIGNQIGAMAFGGVGFGVRMATNMATDFFGGGAKDLDKAMSKVNANVIRTLGGVTFDAIRAKEPGAMALRRQLEAMEQDNPEMIAAATIPAVLAAMAGFMGVFGNPGIAGMNEGVRRAFDEAAKQADQVAAEKGEAHSGWMTYFGGIANDQAANFNAHGPIWNVGPAGGGIIPGGEAGVARFERQAQRRAAVWQRNAWLRRDQARRDGFRDRRGRG